MATSEVVLKYKTDENSVRNVIAQAKKIKDDFGKAGVNENTTKATRDIKETERLYLESAEIIKQKAKEEATLLRASASQLKERARAIQDEIKANQRAIKVLKDSGLQTDAINKKIAEYRKQNKELADTLTFITKEALPKAIREVKATPQRVGGGGTSTLREAGREIKDIAQITAALGVLSGSDLGQTVANIIALSDALKSIGGLSGGLTAITTALTTINPLFLALGAGALVGAVALSELNKRIDEARKAGEAYGNALAEQSKANANAQVALQRGDTETVLRQLKEAQDQRLTLLLEEQSNQEKLNALIAEREKFFIQGAGVFNEVIRALSPEIQGLDAAIAALEASLKDAQDGSFEAALKQQELTDLLLAYGFTIEEIEQGIANLDKTSESASQAVSELTKELLRVTELNRRRIIEEADLLKQSEETLRDRASQIELEIEANRQAIEALKASGDTSEEVAKQIRDYENANVELGKTLEFITNTALPNATARAREEARKADIERTNQDIINATKKYNADLARLEEDNAKELFNIEQRRTDALKRATETYVKDTERALEKLNSDLERNRKQYNEREFEARQKALQDEADALKNHYRNIEDIRTRAQADELEALGNLDFKRAFEIRRNINKELSENQKKFIREAQDRAEAQSRDRQERLRQYAQAQAEAQANYQKELALARENRQRAIAEAQANYQKELVEQRKANEEKLRELQRGYAQELAQAKLTGDQRLALQKQQDAELLAQAQAFLRQIQQQRPIAPMNAPRPIQQPVPQITPRPSSGTTVPKSSAPPVVNVTINGTGNPRQVAQQVIELTRGGKVLT